MANMVLTNASISIGGTDLSDHLIEVSVPEGVEKVDKTAMGADTRQGGASLKTWTITAKFHQDFAASKVDATISPLIGPGLTTTVVVQPVAGARSATSPGWSGLAYISAYNPVSGKVGDELVCDVTFEAAGTLTRLTS